MSNHTTRHEAALPLCSRPGCGRTATRAAVAVELWLEPLAVTSGRGPIDAPVAEVVVAFCSEHDGLIPIADPAQMLRARRTTIVTGSDAPRPGIRFAPGQESIHG